jgi:hypothetical protein
MFQQRYGIRLPWFLPLITIWSIWIAVWAWAPPEELIWGSMKWIIVTIFSPVGIVLLGSLTGYRIEFDGQVLSFGFYPFIRSVHVNDIEYLRTGGFSMSIWHTSDTFRVVTRKGAVVGIPCDNAQEIVRLIEPHISNDGESR